MTVTFQLVKKPFDKLISLSTKDGRNRVLRPEAVQRYCERAKTRLICGDRFKGAVKKVLSVILKSEAMKDLRTKNGYIGAFSHLCSEILRLRLRMTGLF